MSNTGSAQNHMEVFFYMVPKKNRAAVETNLNKFRPWFKKHGVGLEYYSLGSRDSMEMTENIAKKLGATDDEDVWVEVQQYRDRKHAEETFAVMMKDKEIEPIGNEFFGLVSQGKGMIAGGFDKLAAR